jgi:hypothetical protein
MSDNKGSFGNLPRARKFDISINEKGHARISERYLSTFGKKYGGFTALIYLMLGLLTAVFCGVFTMALISAGTHPASIPFGHILFGALLAWLTLEIVLVCLYILVPLVRLLLPGLLVLCTLVYFLIVLVFRLNGM